MISLLGKAIVCCADKQGKKISDNAQENMYKFTFILDLIVGIGILSLAAYNKQGNIRLPIGIENTFAAVGSLNFIVGFAAMTIYCCHKCGGADDLLLS